MTKYQMLEKIYYWGNEIDKKDFMKKSKNTCIEIFDNLIENFNAKKKREAHYDQLEIDLLINMRDEIIDLLQDFNVNDYFNVEKSLEIIFLFGKNRDLNIIENEIESKLRVNSNQFDLKDLINYKNKYEKKNENFNKSFFSQCSIIYINQILKIIYQELEKRLNFKGGNQMTKMTMKRTYELLALAEEKNIKIVSIQDFINFYKSL